MKESQKHHSKYYSPYFRRRRYGLPQAGQASIRKAISTMNRDQLEDMMRLTLEKQPGLMFDVWEEIYQATPESPSSPTCASNKPPWCVCNHCREMPTDLERLCCGIKPDNCISTAPELELLVLDPHVLQVANWYRQDILAREPGYDKKAKRHAAYRQFTLWRYGRLGTGNRRVIPSCVVWRVRQQYPDPTGHYTGFILNKLN